MTCPQVPRHELASEPSPFNLKNPVCSHQAVSVTLSAPPTPPQPSLQKRQWRPAAGTCRVRRAKKGRLHRRLMLRSCRLAWRRVSAMLPKLVRESLQICLIICPAPLQPFKSFLFQRPCSLPTQFERAIKRAICSCSQARTLRIKTGVLKGVKGHAGNNGRPASHGKWTSFAVILNPHKDSTDMGNMIGMPNYAIALGSFAGGKVWIEDEQGTSLDEVVMKNKIHQLRGSWLDMHDNPVSFDARRFHKVEPHIGHMWAIAAYTPTAFKRCSNENAKN